MRRSEPVWSEIANPRWMIRSSFKVCVFRGYAKLQVCHCRLAWQCDNIEETLLDEPAVASTVSLKNFQPDARKVGLLIGTDKRWWLGIGVYLRPSAAEFMGAQTAALSEKLEYGAGRAFLGFWQIRTKTSAADSSLRQHDSAMTSIPGKILKNGGRLNGDRKVRGR